MNANTLDMLDKVQDRLETMIWMINALHENATDRAISGACDFISDTEALVQRIAESLQQQHSA